MTIWVCRYGFVARRVCLLRPRLFRLGLIFVAIWLPGPDGRRPAFGGVELLQADPAWRSNLLFFEYFNGDDGAGLGAMHQTGWTALVADLIIDRALPRRAGTG